jgi:Domain of unknown function (DUF4143)
VFLVMRLPAWGTTLRARSANAPKVHVVDSGIAARLLALTPEKLARRDPSSLSQLGHLLETFVVGELIRDASLLDEVSGCGHWRTHDGQEVDLIVERGDGGSHTAAPGYCSPRGAQHEHDSAVAERFDDQRTGVTFDQHEGPCKRGRSGVADAENRYVQMRSLESWRRRAGRPGVSATLRGCQHDIAHSSGIFCVSVSKTLSSSNAT